MSHVIVVDDNDTNLLLLRHILLKLDGVAVDTFSDPLQALQWCQQNEPDLILLDYMMPEIDGLEFMRRFYALPHRQEVPIVMVTADTERDVRHLALEQGARDFLTKPVDKVELTVRVRNLLALRKSTQQLANRAAWLLEEVKQATAEIRAREKEAILRLSRAAEYRDPETGAHLLRMSAYTRLIARQVGLPLQEQEMLQEAAPMHDIGKVGIPDAILLKPGKLTAEEMAVMRQHPSFGHEILTGSVSPLLQCAAVVALSHHEKYDGSGYPQGLAGQDIPLWGRIVAIADVFDALTSARPYKKAWPLDKAREFLISQKNHHFDPECVDALLAVWPEVITIRQQYADEYDAAGSHGHFAAKGDGHA
ncbi:MAG: response regulator [Aquitalea sp.]|nr:response regulator [Aquitalea sp.]